MWIQIFCTASNGYRDPAAMKRVDDHVSSMTTSTFVAPFGVPLKNESGEYECRVMNPVEHGLVEAILTRHYGLHITRVVENKEISDVE